MSIYGFASDDRGAPVLLDTAVEAKPKPQPKADHDPAQGSVSRRRDAVVDAARTLDDLSPAGVEAFARRHWRGDRPITPEDFKSFSADALEQRTHDIVDALHHRINRAINGRVGSKQPHVALPRGLGAKSLASLQPEQTTAVIARLRDRGWTDQQIKRHALRRLDKDGKTREQME